jgi:diamine N-acetyltransferase
MLKTTNIKLRAVEPVDVDYLFDAENETSLWSVSETLVPFSKNTLKKYAESTHNLAEQGQFRFIIEDLETKKPIGMVDLFDYNAIHRRAGVGIVISNEEFKNHGIATQALSLLIEYCKSVLRLNQLHCSIHASNEISINLFERLDFDRIGERKDWYWNGSNWESEVLFQKILM